ncbi:toxin-activating lysine-acyltransferase, partial [Salmonella enterica subsp. enterica serovar Typhimurium]|nr:toxin-activating lysine-acyltransferase [Salmonella enterica subsp. enterica serovar Typhimurium]
IECFTDLRPWGEGEVRWLNRRKKIMTVRQNKLRHIPELQKKI